VAVPVSDLAAVVVLLLPFQPVALVLYKNHIQIILIILPDQSVVFNQLPQSEETAAVFFSSYALKLQQVIDLLISRSIKQGWDAIVYALQQVIHLGKDDHTEPALQFVNMKSESSCLVPASLHLLI
jgi:hypothetical protein